MCNVGRNSALAIPSCLAAHQCCPRRRFVIVQSSPALHHTMCTTPANFESSQNNFYSFLSPAKYIRISVFHRHSILMTTRLVCLASASSTLGTEIMFPLQSPCCPYLFTTHSQLVTQQYHCITAYFHPQLFFFDRQNRGPHRRGFDTCRAAKFA